MTAHTQPGEGIALVDQSFVQDQVADKDALVRFGIANAPSVRFSLASLPSFLPLIFMFLATSTVVFLSVCTPPFQTPDEDVHFKRAYQVSNGILFHADGGEVDEAIDEAISPYSQLPHNTEVKLTAANEDAGARVKWTGKKVYRVFATSSYAPTGYIPQALGIVLGRLMNLSVVSTLLLSRLLNGAFAISISTLALCWCGRGRLVMFTILLMPMTMSLFGSCNQDASTISLACLAFAILSRQIEEDRPFSLRMSVAFALTLLVISIARPPYAAFLLAFLIPGMVPQSSRLPGWLSKLLFIGLPFVLTSAWWFAAILSTKAKYQLPGIYGTVDPKAQLLFVFHHPGVLLATLGKSQIYVTLLAGIIANLGWLDTKMPFYYYMVMILILLVAMTGEIAYRGRFRRSAMVSMFLATPIAAAGIIFSAYLLWDAVGSEILLGVQGRYFIPLVIAVGVVLPPLHRSDRLYRWLTAVIVCSQVITFIQLPWTLIKRYYLR